MARHTSGHIYLTTAFAFDALENWMKNHSTKRFTTIFPCLSIRESNSQNDCIGEMRRRRPGGTIPWCGCVDCDHWAIFIWRPIIVAIIDSVLQRIVFAKFAVHSNATFYFCHRFLFNILHIRNFGDFIIFDIRANKTWLNFFRKFEDLNKQWKQSWMNGGFGNRGWFSPKVGFGCAQTHHRWLQYNKILLLTVHQLNQFQIKSSKLLHSPLLARSQFNQMNNTIK